MKMPFGTLVAGAILFCTTSVWAEETIVVPRFDLKHLYLEGNTILAPQDVEAILNKYVGPQKDFGTLQEAMEELETAYKKRGYTMVTVILPEQELANGTVHFKVLEPHVTSITLEGNNHFDKVNILATLPALRVGSPPQVSAISENLRAVNENPAKKLTLQFKTKDNPEELEAFLQVKDQKPWTVALTGDNTGTKQSGYYRMGLLLQHANLWNLDHVAALQYSTSPDHLAKVKIISGSYRIPLYSLGDTVDLFGGYSDVDNGTSRISGTDLSISGKGIVSGVRYNWTLPRAGAYEQKLSFGMDYRRYDNTATLGGTGSDLSPDVVAHPFSLTYGGTWVSDLASVDGYLGVLHNEPWGGQGQQADFELMRSGSVADYWIFRYGFNKMVRPGGDWIFRVAGNGQYTPDRLIPGEQFGLGGAASVRGYAEREESYDAGFAGSFELYSPDLGPLLTIPQTQVRLVGFFDGGYGYNLRPQLQSSEIADHSLTSSGAGIRLGFGSYFSFSLDWGYALDDSNSSAESTRRGDHRIHFKAQLAY